MKECYLCASKKSHIIHKGVRDGQDIDVLKCDECGLVRLSKFIKEPETFYKTSEMRKADGEKSVQSIQKEVRIDDERRFIFLEKMIENKNILDFGCGAGGFLLRAQKIAKHVTGIELEDNMNSYLNNQGIKCYSSLNHAPHIGTFDLITMFHVLEHLEDPCQILRQLQLILADDGCIIIEVPNANDALLTLYQSAEFADFTYWKCHLYLYTTATIERLAQKCGFKIKFIKQVQRYPLSNHLYWLAKTKPGGHVQWSFLNSKLMEKEYENVLSSLGIADTIVAALVKE